MKLSEFLGKFPSYEETEDGYLTHCTAHNDSHASLRVAVSDSGKVLLKCRAGCETADVLEAMNLTMRDVMNITVDVQPDHTATAADVPASDEDVAAITASTDAWAAQYQSDAAADARAYAKSRFGVDDEIALRLGLGFTDELGGGPRLVVPFRDKNGVVRGYQARSLDKDARVRWLGPKSPDGANWAKVAWFPGGSGWDEVIVCEGPGDALTGAALGYDTIGVRGAGLASNDAVVSTIVEMAHGRTVVVAGDGDPAGRRFSASLAEALAARDVSVRILDLPDGQDLTSMRESDTSAFSRNLISAIAQSTPVTSRNAALLAWDEERYSLSDLGGARYLRDYIASIGSGVKFTPEAGFFLLEDGVWVQDTRQTVRTYAQAVADVVKTIAGQAAEIAGANGATAEERSRAGRLRSYANHAQTSRGLDSMIRELQAVENVPASINDFDQHNHLLAAKNGVVDLRTGELLPHNASYLLSRRVDHDYNPSATCPRWDAFLGEVFPNDPAMPAYLQTVVGYGITGNTSEQIFVIHLGGGANGKSVYLDTLTEVFRAITTTTPFSTFEAKPSGGIPNDIAALKGARLVMASEGEIGKRMAEAVLKRVTGRDMISARFMRQEFFEFRPQFLLQMATNNEPYFRGQDHGLWRRVKLVKWERQFALHEQDRRLPEKLAAESEGIFAWAVRGAVEWYSNGLNDSPWVTEATHDYRQTSNILDGFLPGVYVHDDDGKAVLGNTLFADFQSWAEEENLLDLRKWSRKTFYAALAERGIEKRTAGGNKTVFDGIKRADLRATDPQLAVSFNETTVGRVSGANLAVALSG